MQNRSVIEEAASSDAESESQCISDESFSEAGHKKIQEGLLLGPGVSACSSMFCFISLADDNRDLMNITTFLVSSCHRFGNQCRIKLRDIRFHRGLLGTRGS